MLRMLLALGGIFFAAAVAAEPISREALEALIEAEGYNDAADSRTVVSVENCVIQIDVYRPYKAPPDDLWSSFRADVRGIEMPVADAASGDRFRYTEEPKGDPPPIAFWFFEMQPPFLVRHEQPLYRNPQPPFSASPRDGVHGYVYQERDAFFVIQYEQESPRKSRRFAAALMQYKREFCLALS